MFDRLSEGRWDVLVVGAGIGSRVAYEAALVRPQPMVLAEPAGYPLPVYAAGLALYRTIAGLRTPGPQLISAIPSPHVPSPPTSRSSSTRRRTF